MTDVQSLREAAIRDRWRIAILVTAVVGLAYYFGFNPQIPRRAKLFGMAFVAASLAGFPAATRVVDYLYRPTHTHLVEFDAETDTLRIWQLPASTWRELTVEDGEIYPLQADSPAWECRSYDPEDNVATGTWRGSATDLELVESRAAINDIRNELEDMAQEGLTIRVKQSTIVRTAVKDIVMAFLRDYESETVYSGDELQTKIDDAVDSFTLKTDTDEDDSQQPADDGTNAEPNVDESDDADPLEAMADGG